MIKIADIITKVNTAYGAPLGRNNKGTHPVTVTRGRNCRICKCDQVKVYTKRVRLDSQGYDKGGAYWGLGSNIYVSYTQDLSYIEFNRI